MKDKYIKTLAPILKEAGAKAKNSWYKFNRNESSLKSKTQIVTKVDKNTEKFIIKKIKQTFPEHNFLGEEFGLEKHKSDYLWIIDPIDGTTNFSIHNPLWSISVALAYKNEIIFGIIYIPLLDEIFWGELNKGAYLNNKKLKIKPLNQKRLIHTFCHGDKKRDVTTAIKYYQIQKQNSLDCRQLGSAAIELSYVASSRVDSLLIPGARSWDVAAGTIIAQEAGANVSDFNGEKWNLKSRDILACHPEIKTEILKKIKKII
jgi:myo-inositol-1(or 4)-monophosphatase